MVTDREFYVNGCSREQINPLLEAEEEQGTRSRFACLAQVLPT